MPIKTNTAAVTTAADTITVTAGAKSYTFPYDDLTDARRVVKDAISMAGQAPLFGTAERWTTTPLGAGSSLIISTVDAMEFTVEFIRIGYAAGNVTITPVNAAWLSGLDDALTEGA